MSKNRNKRPLNPIEQSSAKKKKKITDSPSKKVPEKAIYTSDDSSESSSEDFTSNDIIDTPPVSAEVTVVTNGMETEVDPKHDLPQFTFSDMNKLLENVRRQLPDTDSLKYNTRIEKLDWDKVKFDQFDGESTKKLFLHSISFIRKYKTLHEILTETQQIAAKPTSKIYRSKDSQKPRHPSSSYMIFANEIREKLRKQNPTLTIIEIGKLIGEKWRALPQSKKDKYVKLFEENKKIYLAEVSKYNDDHHFPERKKKELDKPKTPLAIYLSEKLEKENPDLDGKTVKEKQVYYKNKYNQLSDKKKHKYIKKCMDAENEFLEKLKDKLKTTHVEYKSVLNKQEREIVDKMNGKPDNPPVNGYALFIKENITKPEFANVEPKLRNSLMAIKWKELDKSEREAFNGRSKAAQEQFQHDMSNYVKSLPEKQAVELYMSSVGLAKDIIARRIEALAK